MMNFKFHSEHLISLFFFPSQQKGKMNKSLRLLLGIIECQYQTKFDIFENVIGMATNITKYIVSWYHSY